MSAFPDEEPLPLLEVGWMLSELARFLQECYRAGVARGTVAPASDEWSAVPTPEGWQPPVMPSEEWRPQVLRLSLNSPLWVELTTVSGLAATAAWLLRNPERIAGFIPVMRTTWHKEMGKAEEAKHERDVAQAQREEEKARGLAEIRERQLKEKALTMYARGLEIENEDEDAMLTPPPGPEK